ncbi:hypothetical protein MJ575_28375 [Klebsiella pneumoniae]|nr:hypothetical protein MJ575_28375 [Klebsiella pneumoniae]
MSFPQQYGDAEYRRVYRVWGIITALFIPGQGGCQIQNAGEAGRSDITYLLPLLIGYNGGKLVGGERGGVVGAITTHSARRRGICRCSSAQYCHSLCGYRIKKFDNWVDGKIKSGF